MSDAHPLRGPVSEALHGVPLRLRLVVVTVGLLVTALAIAGLAASFRVEDFVIRQKAAELQNSAGQIESQVKYGLEEIPSASTSQRYGVYSVAIQVNGEAPSGAGPDEPNIPAISPTHEFVVHHRSFIVPSRDGDDRWIVVAYPGPSTNSTMTVAAPLATTDATITQLRWSTIFISLLAAAITAMLGWFLIRRAFRPLRQIEDTAQAIAAGDLTRRIPPTSTQDEISSLSQSLNMMLSRIEQSFAVRSASEDQMRRFVADASHELRTPLATVRGYAELYRQGAVTDPDDVSSAMRRIEDEAVRMSALVEDLLLLTRIDRRDLAADRPLIPELVDLTVLAAEAVQDAGARDPDREIRLQGWNGPVTPTSVIGDEAQLRQVLGNFLTNAMRYTPPGTPVEVLVGQTDSGPVLAVRDHGPGIPPDQRHRVFERFYRGESSRNTALGGSGLGLAIVHAIVSSHRGDVTVEDTAGGGATFVVRFTQEPHSPAQDDG
ncbi:sensor histidine kinase [Demetria terragena]|uniref:sensor histidine kinase n=1 Tax=Demetria terragena TaxID=63959 RepID=UPI00036A77F6|nr:HAMP domain-containing sensor histidine kinase [Demetria terragena]